MFRKRSNRDALTRKPAGPVVIVGIRRVRFFRAELPSSGFDGPSDMSTRPGTYSRVAPGLYCRYLAVECNQGESKGLGQETILADNPRHEREECKGCVQDKHPRAVPVSGPQCMKWEIAQFLIAA